MTDKNKMIENPFSDEERALLKKLSKLAKNKNLLGNAGKKYLYECGAYDKWFYNRLFELKITLWILYNQITDEKQKVLNMIDILTREMPELVLNEHAEKEGDLVNNCIQFFEKAYKSASQEDYLNMLKVIESNRSFLSESFIKTAINLSKLLENIKSKSE